MSGKLAYSMSSIVRCIVKCLSSFWMQIKFNPFSFTDRFNQSLEVWWNNAAGGLRQTGEGVPVMGG